MDRNRGLDINALRQQLEDLFEDFFPASQDRRRGHRGGDQTQHLPLNVAETDEAFTLTAPLPGFQPEDVDITVRGQNVAVRAQQKTPPPEQENLTRHEWGQGTFQRSFELPAPVDAEQTTASFRQGVVTIVLPKAAPSDVPVEDEDEAPAETVEAAAEEGAAEAAPDETAGSGAGAEAAPQQEKSSFYMSPGRGRRGRRHAGKNAEQAPVPDAVAQEQAAGAAEGESRDTESGAPADEAEAREQDREEQSGFGASEEPAAVETAATPEDVVVAETLDMGGETPAPEAAQAAADAFAEESEKASEPPTE